jgi:hypothetical protein
MLAKSDRDSEQSQQASVAQWALTSDENSTAVTTPIWKHPKHATRHAPELLRRLHDVLSFFENFPSSRSSLAGTAATSDDLHIVNETWTIEVFSLSNLSLCIVEPLMQLSCLQDHLLRSTACSNPLFVAYLSPVRQTIFAQQYVTVCQYSSFSSYCWQVPYKGSMTSRYPRKEKFHTDG